MALKDLVMIAAPCPVSWETMAGDNRVRFCSGCSKNVYNLSDMSDAELELFLKEKGDDECFRLYRRNDGTIMTDNCPRALRAVRNKYKLALRVAASVLASMFAFVQGVCAQNRYTITRDTNGDSIIMPV